MEGFVAPLAWGGDFTQKEWIFSVILSDMKRIQEIYRQLNDRLKARKEIHKD